MRTEAEEPQPNRLANLCLGCCGQNTCSWACACPMDQYTLSHSSAPSYITHHLPPPPPMSIPSPRDDGSPPNPRGTVTK